MLKALKILWCLPLILLSGCWDQEEIEALAYVVVIGLDMKEGNMIDVTFQIANPQVGSTDRGQAQSESASEVVTIAAPDILSAKELANASVSRKMNFDHLRTIIVSEELAKMELFPDILSSAIIDPEVRRNIVMIVSKEKASSFIHKNKPQLETRPHKYYNFMTRLWSDTGFSPMANLNDYFLQLENDLFLAAYATTERDETDPSPHSGFVAGQVPQQSGDPVQMMGSAVFKKGKMIGTLSGRETRIALFLRPNEGTYIQTDIFDDPLDPEKVMSVKIIRDGQAKVKIDKEKDPVKIDVTVSVNLQMFSNPSSINYTTNIDNQNRLKKALKEGMEKNTLALVKKAQEEYKAEPFLWSLIARKHFWTLDEFKEFDWNKKYENADINVEYIVEIESFGEIIRPTTTKGTP